MDFNDVGFLRASTWTAAGQGDGIRDLGFRGQAKSVSRPQLAASSFAHTEPHKLPPLDLGA